MKVFFRNIHLYLSLAAGLIIMISCSTGAILVFEHEIDHAINHKRYIVEAKGERLPISALVENATKAAAKGKIASVKVFKDPNRSVEIGFVVPEKKAESESKKSDAEKGKTGSPEKKAQKSGPGKPSLFVYLNPYNAEVIEVFNRRSSFFFTVEMIHRWLLTGKDGIGKTIVGVSTLFFLFILITGLILWWPKTKAILRQRLKIKTNASWKRLNHDLHIVTGFYTSLFLIVIVMTGLVMSFNWVNKGIFTLTGSKMENPEPPESAVFADSKSVGIDEVYREVSTKVTNAQFYTLRSPKDSSGVYSVTVLPANTLETAMDTYFVDQYSGTIIGSNMAANKNLGQKIRSYVKPVHTGAVYGIPTKILSLLIALLTFTFPITGVIMWLNRLKSEKKKKQRKSEASPTFA